MKAQLEDTLQRMETPLNMDTVAARLDGAVSPLMEWFAGHARVLPWRSHPDPYRVWVSEIMLQQTRVSAVLPYFQRFMDALPTVFELAQVEERVLLKLWEGLGYYSRARNLQKAARIIVERYGGEMPATYRELSALPGIGDYTAGAILSIAYGQRVPAVDGNVLRVLSRLLYAVADVMRPDVRKAFRTLIAAHMPDDPSRFNQALMELGATVCLPNGTPLCMECPLNELCEAHRRGREMQLPVKAAKKQRRVEKRTVLLVHCGGKVLVRKRPDRGLLANLWEFAVADGFLSPFEVQDVVCHIGLVPLQIFELPDAKHIFTHVEWLMQGYDVVVGEPLPVKGYRWATWDELQEDFPVPSAYKVYLECLPKLLSPPYENDRK